MTQREPFRQTSRLPEVVDSVRLGVVFIERGNSCGTGFMVYYSQAWSLVWDEEPLFDEKIEAWANGPVVRELFEEHRGQFKVHSIPVGDPDNLNQTQEETVLGVLDYYGPKTSQWLSDLTHLEDPWREARKGIPEHQRGFNEITRN